MFRNYILLVYSFARNKTIRIFKYKSNRHSATIRLHYMFFFVVVVFIISCKTSSQSESEYTSFGFGKRFYSLSMPPASKRDTNKHLKSCLGGDRRFEKVDFVNIYRRGIAYIYSSMFLFVWYDLNNRNTRSWLTCHVTMFCLYSQENFKKECKCI